ncbi:DNA alkylation repair protein [Lachnospiraceae bacterium MD335]|nr:DNA alkylation repair protein [Lachnospiraceae bacterium MD335]
MKKKCIKLKNGEIYELPIEDVEFLKFSDELIKTRNYYTISLITNEIKKRKSLYDIKYMDIYKSWLYESTSSWEICDILCYRVLNPMIEKKILLFDEVLQWAKSDKTYVKRAAAVCLLHSSQTFSVIVPFEFVKSVTELLLDDTNIHVQKGVGWLLKYSYCTYPTQTFDFIKKFVDKMSSKTFFYALEKFSPKDRNELIDYRKSILQRTEKLQKSK